jgi:hypothetical protein
MVGTLIVVYLACWMLASFAAYAVGRRLADRQTHPNQPLIVAVSVAAGAVWPLLVVGLIELSSVMVLTKVPSKPGRGLGIYA